MAPALHVHKLVLMQGACMIITYSVHMSLHVQRHVCIARAKQVISWPATRVSSGHPAPGHRAHVMHRQTGLGAS